MKESHVYDTYAKTIQGRIMHFDVVMDEKNSVKALENAKHWLTVIGYPDSVVTQENCVYCHSAEAPPELREQIDSQGYAIIKMEGCPK
jgi:hypothetical protein